jgi:gliding motility-associated-like protein
MMILDRWGNLIFETNDLDTGWDGRANGGADVAQQDVYVYAIKLKDFKNKTYQYRGHVTLLK